MREDTTHLENYGQCNALIGAIYHALDTAKNKASSQFLNGAFARKYLKASDGHWRASTPDEEAALLDQYARRPRRVSSARDVADIRVDIAAAKKLALLAYDAGESELGDAQGAKVTALESELTTALATQKKIALAAIEAAWGTHADQIIAYAILLSESDDSIS